MNHDRAWTSTLAASAVVAAAALAIMASTLWQSVRPPWNPIGDFPEQEVTEVNDTFVHVVGTKCYDEDVTVRGSFGWQRVDPPGFAITLGEGVADREAGCLTQEFDNNIPASVLDANTPGATWRITGTETPFDDDREGLPRVWQTEPFTLKPTG